MLCYPVREVMLWQLVGNPDCLVSHRVVSRSAAVEAVVTCVCLGKGRPNLEVRWMRTRQSCKLFQRLSYTFHLSLQECLHCGSYGKPADDATFHQIKLSFIYITINIFYLVKSCDTYYPQLCPQSKSSTCVLYRHQYFRLFMFKYFSNGI